MKSTRFTSVVTASVLGLVTPLIATATVAPAQAAGVTQLSFEDIPASCAFASVNPLRDRYAAAKFRGASTTAGGAVLDNCANFGIAPRTGSRFLAFNSSSTMSNGGAPVGPEKIVLPTRQRSVALWVSQSGFNLGTATFKMVGRRGSTVVRTATVTTTTADWVKVQVAAARGITSVTVSTPTEPDGIWLADDLTLRN
jgi:hypothetical protein